MPKIGHGKFAEELRALVDQAKARRGLLSQGGGTLIPIGLPARGDLADLLNATYPVETTTGQLAISTMHLAKGMELSCRRGDGLR